MGSRGFHLKAAKGLNCHRGKFNGVIQRGPRNQGAQTMVEWFSKFAMLYLGNGAR